MAREGQVAAQPAEEALDRQLLEHYLAGAGEKLAALEAALAAARTGEAGAGDVLRRALHKRRRRAFERRRERERQDAAPADMAAATAQAESQQPVEKA